MCYKVLIYASDKKQQAHIKQRKTLENAEFSAKSRVLFWCRWRDSNYAEKRENTCATMDLRIYKQTNEHFEKTEP
jgi:hypothetical protein